MFDTRWVIKEVVLPVGNITNYNIFDGSNIGVVTHEVAQLLELGRHSCAGVAAGAETEKIVWVQAMVQYGNE